ncbi:MAG: DUF202 domain-containing protein [Actinomycetota bacterium]|nr:DUF202 domain-containing protein [Actinomycetota bacterium]
MGRQLDWLYGAGEEPDYRFSLANERTMLAWLRTALALIAAGVAVDAIDLSLPDRLQTLLAGMLLLLGMLCAGGSWLRWALIERAMRQSRPLPRYHVGLITSVGVALVAAIALIALVAL